MRLKHSIINEIIEVEGGYVNDPSDSGGETNFGITIAVARNEGYRGPISELPREKAFEIYSQRYWSPVQADDFATLSESLTRELVDTGVNMGPARAGKFLQRALNALNNRGDLYPDLTVDGAIGPATVEAARRYAAKRDLETLTKALNCLQGAYYIELAERREKDERFVYGWLRNRVKL